MHSSLSAAPPLVYKLYRNPNLTLFDEGSNLTLAVTIMYDTMEYLPLTDVSWVMPDGATTNSSINSTLPAYAGPVTSSFHLSSLSPDDVGVYAVTASNDAGSTIVNFTIAVFPGKIICTYLCSDHFLGGFLPYFSTPAEQL
jgi:hypothetical protein